MPNAITISNKSPEESSQKVGEKVVKIPTSNVFSSPESDTNYFYYTEIITDRIPSK
jgi:hypothetical protein